MRTQNIIGRISSRRCQQRWIRGGIRAWVCFLLLPGGVRSDDIRPEFAMFQDPQLTPPTRVLRLRQRQVALWIEALSRPEADNQRLAAEAIAEAVEDGYPVDKSSTEIPLINVLTGESVHPTAAFTAARALIALNARDAAGDLFEASQRHGTRLRMLVEPALADWDFQPIRTVWLDRVRDPQTERRELSLALDGLGKARLADALPSVLILVHSPSAPADIRLSAAKAAGAISEAGLESDAQRLMKARQVVRRLCAVALLSRHRSERSVQILGSLAADDEPTVVEQALGLLYRIDPQLVIPLAEAAMQSDDPKVRRRGADAYVALPTMQRIIALSRLLDDVHPDVRRAVRDNLFQLADQPELSAAVRESAMDVLHQESWRGQEQAALLLAALDHKPAANRLMELLGVTRPEVMVASAWGLKQLAIPATAESIRQHVQRQTDERLTEEIPEGLDEQVAHLFEALARLSDAESEPLMREYVPKRPLYGIYSRAAAVWSLGILHSAEPDEDLVRQFMERLFDLEIEPPELEIVWRMSATSIGRMHAESELDALRERLGMEVPLSGTFLAIRWAIEEISGEALPELPAPVRTRINWFLQPISAP